MDAPIENSPPEIELLKNINPFGLDKNTAHIISSYLTNRDLVNVCMSSKGLHSIFYPPLERRLTSFFLKFVVEGRLDKVEEILNRNKKLVLLHGDIIDLSDRQFKRITAFQYAVWALGKEMWELILRYLPEVDAYDQLMAFEQERPDITQVHGTRLNFSPLLNAYQKYVDNFDAWSEAKQWKRLETCWCEAVSGAQRQMPAWFVYMFCEEGSDKAWPTKDFKKSFTRDPKRLSWWFDGKAYGGKLGVKWGAGRGVKGEELGGGPMNVVMAVFVVRGVTSAVDRQHLNFWKAKRMSCQDSLSDYLKSVAERKNSATKSNNFGK